MDSLLSILAMVGGLLLLGWIVGSSQAQVKDALPGGEPQPEGVPAHSGPFEER